MNRSLSDIFFDVREGLADRLENWSSQTDPEPEPAYAPPLDTTAVYLVRLPQVGALDARLTLAAWDTMRPDIQVQTLRPGERGE